MVYPLIALSHIRQRTRRASDATVESPPRASCVNYSLESVLVMPVSRGARLRAGHRDPRMHDDSYPLSQHDIPAALSVTHPLSTNFISDTRARGHPVLVPHRGAPSTRVHHKPRDYGVGAPGRT